MLASLKRNECKSELTQFFTVALTLSFIMLKNSQTYFKNMVVLRFLKLFGYFSPLYMKVKIVFREMFNVRNERESKVLRPTNLRY